jgi:hypothetical protein
MKKICREFYSTCFVIDAIRETGPGIIIRFRRFKRWQIFVTVLFVVTMFAELFLFFLQLLLYKKNGYYRHIFMAVYLRNFTTFYSTGVRRKSHINR